MLYPPNSTFFPLFQEAISIHLISCIDLLRPFTCHPTFIRRTNSWRDSHTKLCNYASWRSRVTLAVFPKAKPPRHSASGTPRYCQAHLERHQFTNITFRGSLSAAPNLRSLLVTRQLTNNRHTWTTRSPTEQLKTCSMLTGQTPIPRGSVNGVHERRLNEMLRGKMKPETYESLSLAEALSLLWTRQLGFSGAWP